MKTIELSDQESRYWVNDAGFRTEVRRREQERARRLNEHVEVYLNSGRRLFEVAPAEA